MNPTPERVERHGEVVARWQTSDLVDEFPVLSTFQTNDIHQRMMILSLVDAESRPGGDLVGEQFEIGEFIIHPVPLENEDGEIKICRRIVLPQSSGSPIAFVSEGVIKSIARIAWALGSNPPWDPPVKVVLKQRNIKGGRRYFQLGLVKD